MNNCPKRAIETAHGYFAGVILLLNLVIIVWFWKWVATFIVIPQDHVWGKIIITIIGWGLDFITFIVMYRLFHYLLRIPLVRDILFYTSLTRFRFWRRYKPSKKMISDLP